MSIASATSPQASAAALTSAANNAASGVTVPSTTSAASASGTSGAATSTNALQSLTGNYQNFLQMLMTQLQNQDPSSPMDPNAFTSELVQFASVEQQINTNQSLTQLIQLTQSGEVLQSANVVGHHVAVQSNQMPVQGGTGEIQFTAAQPGPVAIAVYSASGSQIADATVQATAGTNTWTFNGTASDGTTVPDGAYNVAVMGLDASGNPTPQAFNVVGKATGVQSNSGTMDLEFGSESVPFSAIQSMID